MNYRLGIFDSGLGGLTVLNSIQKLNTNFSAVYLADTARVPYGTKSPLEIGQIASEISQWLSMQNLDAIIVACNTTNSLAIDVLKSNINIPMFDLISSTAQEIRKSRIGVLATPSTVASLMYTRSIKSFNPSAFVMEEACPEFVPIIESGILNSSQIREIVKSHISPLLEAGVESIILGCSHYPFLTTFFEELLPRNVQIIDPSSFLAKRLCNSLLSLNVQCDSPKSTPRVRFCVTSDPISFTKNASYWLGARPEVEVISLRSPSYVF